MTLATTRPVAGLPDRPRLATRRTPQHDTATDDTALHVLEHGRAVINGLLARYAQLQRSDATAPAACRDLVQQLCRELAVYMHVQEELLYPKLREQVSDSSPIDRSEIENECLRDLMQRLMGVAADEPLFDARITVLAEIFSAHAGRERVQLQPLLQALDGRHLGRQVADRRNALLAELAERPHTLRIENEEADPVGEPPR